MGRPVTTLLISGATAFPTCNPPWALITGDKTNKSGDLIQVPFLFHLQGGPSGRGQCFCWYLNKRCVLVYEFFTVSKLLICCYVTNGSPWPDGPTCTKRLKTTLWACKVGHECKNCICVQSPNIVLLNKMCLSRAKSQANPISFGQKVSLIAHREHINIEG